MNNRNYTLIRESFECSTYEQDRMVFIGKLISIDDNNEVFEFAFKVENQIMRMSIHCKKNECVIFQNYPDSNAEINLLLNKKAPYYLNLSNGYKLTLITEASLIKCDEFEIKLKYNLYDEHSDKVISINEITIIGENEIC